tara:strand:+ start:2952 stop:3485 length:534 start_codon:yes stop_codon:yes gene_type:complete
MTTPKNKDPRPTPYTTICVSGGFDPVHIGHLRMIQEASQFGHVIVVVNSDEWLMRKKGYIFMPFKERCEILEGFAAVGETTYVDDDDNSVCEALRRIKPDYFANGGDRKTDNTPEMDVCKELGVELLWNVGGGKIQSSSTLVTDAGMIMEAPDDDDIPKPTRVEVLQGGDVIKSGDY